MEIAAGCRLCGREQRRNELDQGAGLASISSNYKVKMIVFNSEYSREAASLLLFVRLYL